MPEPNQKKKTFIDDQALMELLIRLKDTDQPQRLAFRFVLALILMRKKLLRYDSSHLEEKTLAGMVSPSQTSQNPTADQAQTAIPTKYEIWVMTPKGQSEPVEVLNPQLDDEQIRQVTAQLGEILESEL